MLIKNPENFGAFFTPVEFAMYIIEKFGIFDEWINGKKILDPTAGEGNFLEAFLELARNKNIEITEEMLHRLYGIELNKNFVDNFFIKIKQKFNIDFPKSNFIEDDVLFFKNNLEVDILVGNPPWKNIKKLETWYKEKINNLINYYELKNKNAKLNSGNINLASLIVLRTIDKFIKNSNRAYFILPSNLFFSYAVESKFRNSKLYSISYIEEIKEKLFKDISVEFVVAEFIKGAKQNYPIDYVIKEKENFSKFKAMPLDLDSGYLIFNNINEIKEISNFNKIKLNSNFLPRQGLKTAGATEVFFCEKYKIIDKNLVKITNGYGKEFIIEKQFLYKTFDKKDKLIILPYFGKKHLSIEQLNKYPYLKEYLFTYENELLARNIKLFKPFFEKGIFWIIYGIGDYSFSKYKVCWKTYCKDIDIKIIEPDEFFGPKVISGITYAYIPCQTLEECNLIKDYFNKNKKIMEIYFNALKNPSFTNFAQPGRIKTFFEFY